VSIAIEEIAPLFLTTLSEGKNPFKEAFLHKPTASQVESAVEELVFHEAAKVVGNAEGLATNLEITSTGRRIERLQRLHCDIRTGYLMRWAEEFGTESGFHDVTAVAALMGDWSWIVRKSRDSAWLRELLVATWE
jgi:hypothetical protein